MRDTKKRGALHGHRIRNADAIPAGAGTAVLGAGPLIRVVERHEARQCGRGAQLLTWCGRENDVPARSHPRSPMEFTAIPEIPDQNRPALPFRPLLLRKKAALPWKIGPHARRQSTTPAARPAAVGCDRRDGRSQSRPVRQPDVAMAPLSHPRLAEALAPRPGTPGTGGHARGPLRLTSTSNRRKPVARAGGSPG